jgi:hypothetical protein
MVQRKIIKIDESLYDRSESQWRALYDNEMHLADVVSDQVTAARKGKETKSWILGESASGPCDECLALAEENQDVPIDQAYSNGSKLPYVHPGCCCSEDYSSGEAE